MDKLIKVQDIADFLHCECIGEPSLTIRSFCSCNWIIKSDCLTFVTEGHELALGFTAVLITKDMYEERQRDFKTYLIVDDPKLAFARVLRKFYEFQEQPFRSTNSTAKIHESVLREGDVIINANVKIQAYCTIGTEGFGHIRNEEGEFEEFPQIGGVILGKGVEIAAGCNVHRGTLDDTNIQEGSKISTHCNIGHNSIIGRHVFIGGNSNLGGSTKVGDYSFLGMRVTTRPGITIGKNCFIAMGSVVLEDVPDGAFAMGHPAEIYWKKPNYKQ